ncbi:MAG: hypothetical protein WC869_02570 [Phycisphaerae bacterium]|jgi:hypothetical protein
MDAKQIQQLRPMLNTYLRQFDDCFGRRGPVAHLKTHLKTYVLTDSPFEPMIESLRALAG